MRKGKAVDQAVDQALAQTLTGDAPEKVFCPGAEMVRLDCTGALICGMPNVGPPMLGVREQTRAVRKLLVENFSKCSRWGDRVRRLGRKRALEQG